MIDSLNSANDVRFASIIRDQVIFNESEFRSSWLAENNKRIVAQENGAHIEQDEVAGVAAAFSYAKRLVAVLAEDDAYETIAYAAHPTETDLLAVAYEFSGLNFLLTDTRAMCAILFTAYDYKLAAGGIQFLSDVAGDLIQARQRFFEFSEDASGAVCIPDRIRNYMSWIDELEAR